VYLRDGLPFGSVDFGCARSYSIRDAGGAHTYHRHSLGDVNGAGLVLFPKEYNLLYHCFGEAGASWPSMNSGYTLPWRDWAYATDDGLGHTIPAADPDG
jgi:hypothetical protein